MADKILPQRVSPFCSPSPHPAAATPSSPTAPPAAFRWSTGHSLLHFLFPKSSLRRGASQARERECGVEKRGACRNRELGVHTTVFQPP